MRQINLSRPIRLNSREFAENQYAYYDRLLAEAPVQPAQISFYKLHLVSRYADCRSLMGDSRFARNRTKATGGRRRAPVPVPRSVALLAESMIYEDDAEHRRLRDLVNRAFRPHAISRLEGRIRQLAEKLLDAAGNRGTVDLLEAYAFPIPMNIIGALVGVPESATARFRESVRMLSRGFTPVNLLHTLFRGMPAAIALIRELIAEKRANPGDDLLSELIEVEQAGDRLTEDEVVSMTFLLVIAGYETTAHLIGNGVLTLLQHPEQLEALRSAPDQLDGAVEEILRYRGPVHGTKPYYAREDLVLHGVPIRKGGPVMPALGAANVDPQAFPDPERFDIGRAPNHHLAFAHGPHFCLGAQLARLETRIALQTLLEHCPDLRLAVSPDALRVQQAPGWHRYEKLPVCLG